MMKSKQIIWYLCGIILVLPSLMYFIINGYLWLFGNSTPNANKMFYTATIGISGVFLIIFIADLWDILR